MFSCGRIMEPALAWQFILESYGNMLSITIENPEDHDMLGFLQGPDSVHRFLESLLGKYRSNDANYPR